MEFLKKLANFIWTKHFLKIAGYIALAYIVVVGGTIFYLDAYTNHGEKIMVPNLIGKNVKTIAPIMEINELKYEILDSIYDPKLAEGTIIDQDPQPTDKSKLFVKEGRIIRLRVSKRSRLVEMPSLIDKSQRFAETILKNRGFKYSLTFRNTTEANGAVLEQLYRGSVIKEGTRLPIGSTIVLVIGRNEGGMPMQIPDLYGLTIFEAKDRLASMPGFTFFPVCEECKTYEDSLAARINSQNPEFIEGILTPPGSTITVNAVLNFVDSRPPLTPQ